jgi:transposase
MRVEYRWEAIELENKEVEQSKLVERKHIAHVLENRGTLKQLLARSRYLLFKPKTAWTKFTEVRYYSRDIHS